jgi:hypothetical protein
MYNPPLTATVEYESLMVEKLLPTRPPAVSPEDAVPAEPHLLMMP